MIGNYVNFLVQLLQKIPPVRLRPLLTLDHSGHDRLKGYQSTASVCECHSYLWKIKNVLPQRSLLCGCGATKLFARGRCSKCYWAWRHDQRKFAGQRRKTILRDGACLICAEIDPRRLICHHRPEGFATLCRRCHPIVHFRHRLLAFSPAALRRLHGELHPNAPEQFELPFGVTEPAVQIPLTGFAGHFVDGEPHDVHVVIVDGA